MSLVSIIIPNFNRVHLLEETLDSIKAQTHKDWECIIVDDGSTDSSEDIIRNYTSLDSRFQFHRRPDNYLKGGNSCRNYGFQLAKGEFINWFDSDDLMAPSKLEENLMAFKNNPMIQVCICQASYFEGKPVNIIRTTEVQSDTIFEDFVLKKVPISCQVPLWRTSFLKDKTLFNPETQRGQEYEVYSHLLYEVKERYLCLHKPLVNIRMHEESITRDYNRGDDAKVRSYLKVFRGVLRQIQELNKPGLIKDFTVIYRHEILVALRSKSYVIAKEELAYLYQNMINKPHYWSRLRSKVAVTLIELTRGKLYYRLKKFI